MTVSSLSVVADLGEVLRARPTPALGAVFGYGHQLEAAELERDLGPLGPLLSAGLLRPVGARAVRSTLAFGMYRGLLLASDRRDQMYRSDHVLGVTWATSVAASLTPRIPVNSALDVGTGCGVQALLMARHADMVTAVDLSKRAVAAARVNAALNGIDTISAVRGDLFGPVAGDRFDLIVANPPYVISPENRFLYRDSELVDDAMSRRCVVEGGRALAEGGIAIVLVEWLDGASRTWDRPMGWVAETGCAGWVMSHSTRAAQDYVDLWISVPHIRSDEAGVRRAWMEYFERSGASSVTSGVVVLHKPVTGQSWIHATDFVPNPVGDVGPQVLRGLNGQRLTARGRLDTGVTTLLRLAPDVWTDGRGIHTPLGLIPLSDSDKSLVHAISSGAALAASRLDLRPSLLRLIRAGAFDGLPG